MKIAYEWKLNQACQQNKDSSLLQIRINKSFRQLHITKENQ